jgi:hypothetical protein
LLPDIIEFFEDTALAEITAQFIDSSKKRQQDWLYQVIL